MFAPGLLTGELIARTSPAAVMLAGLLCFGATMAVALSSQSFVSFVAALVRLRQHFGTRIDVLYHQLCGVSSRAPSVMCRLLEQVLTGVGWNFLFTAGTTALTLLPIAKDELAVAQAATEVLTWTATVVCALLAGYVQARGGWNAVGWSATPVLALTFLVIGAHVMAGFCDRGAGHSPSAPKGKDAPAPAPVDVESDSGPRP